MASQIVWLDAYITNVDRTFKNTNMLIWHKELWLIDHGACLYFHHSFNDWQGHAKSPFALIKDHVLLPKASMLAEADAEAKNILTDSLLQQIANLIPDEWLQWEGADETPGQLREVYLNFLKTRRDHSEIFIKEAQNARETVI
jgi:hypothetical protein